MGMFFFFESTNLICAQKKKRQDQFLNGKLLPSLNYTLKNVPSFHLLVNQVSAANAPATQSTNLFLGAKRRSPKMMLVFLGVKRRSPKK